MSWVPTTQAALQPDPLVAKHPPASQKAATMTVAPTTASIEQLVSICGLDAATAARFLRAKQNDVNAAMNAVFDGENIDKLEEATTWDESVWQTDREGNELHPLGASIPTTGRNSPAQSLRVTNPKTKADEDRDLEAALAASRGERGDLPFQQETGRIQRDGSAVAFGPATREQYDSNQWALVPTYSAAQEIVPDVAAQERLQRGREPRMLKHLPDGDYTPNLLTICYAIPKAREAFLMREHVKSDYGHDPEWWKGHAILMPRIVHMADGSAAEPDFDKSDELISETQRLMAFLDQSHRVYATIGGITDTDVIKNNNLQATNSGSLLELFLQSWVMAAASKMGDNQAAIDQVASLFNTTVGTTGKQGMATPNLTVVDLSVNAAEDEKHDLVELLDNLLWDTNPDEVEQVDNFIEHPADILVMRVTGSNPSLGLEIPASLQLDKYLQQNVAATRSVRQEMTQGKKRIKNIEKIEKKLQRWQHPSKSTQIDSRKLLEHTLGHYSGKNRKEPDDADQSSISSSTNGEFAHYPDVAQQLEHIITSIGQKLDILAEEKEKTRKAVSDMSRADPPGLAECETRHRYTLRGVATKPNITYTLQAKAIEDSGDMVFQHDDDTTPEGFQWWRLQYDTSASNAKLLRTKVGDYDVLRAVELEHNSALLVYASDEAADSEAYCDEEIPESLRAFVERDNNDFASELARNDPNPPAYDDTLMNHYEQVPRYTGQRRDSLDSTKVVLDEMDDRDSPILDGSSSVDDPSQHHAYGIGYGTRFDPDPVDIHLDPEVHSPGETGRRERTSEMMEKQHEPLVPSSASGPGAVPSEVTHDLADGDVESQDMGMGGDPDIGGSCASK